MAAAAGAAAGEARSGYPYRSAAATSHSSAGPMDPGPSWKKGGQDDVERQQQQLPWQVRMPTSCPPARLTD
jgi:hypothetical protein